MAYLPYVCLALITAAYGVAYYLSCRSYERMLKAAREDQTAVLDRFFVRNHLPPSGINLTEETQDRKKLRELAAAGQGGNGNSKITTPAIGATLSMERELLAQAQNIERSGTIA
jgi:hypothetical protein